MSAASVEAETMTRDQLVSEGLMTVPEAAEFLRLSRASLYNLMERGQLPYVKLGRSRRIPRRAVVGLAAAALSGGDSAPPSDPL